ncbi:Vacuolar protein sorting-associated protein 64 [Psilocybe cubensis]|uniref:Vacuolar protein sorting-associated protein 64 n=2 Tax=Psilocybe cubensis TaxID=181762 RepID=A0ACB8GQ41_PSICU|nr:Vacuolar protein sorting-associated protein 64 [Psilocybe cubensis]KAH9477673.1 Vacuolar protein sorting-associated protein 64 [Psilocybe cubensis]
MSTLTIGLSPAPGTFPFTAKNIPISSTKVILGSIEVTEPGKAARIPSTNNGWFPPKSTDSVTGVSPLPLSSSHAYIWCDGGKVYIRDLDSAFGTFVNGMRISNDTVLKSGDTISLGSRIVRNEKTPAYITDLHVSPIIATVSIKGSRS